MRIIFSRKGFDASAGGVASPILPSGALYSLPIPEPGEHRQRGRPYRELQGGDVPVAQLVTALTRGRLGPGDLAHLDPDLDAESVPRPPGWKPAFGQTAAAESHLRNQGVGPGDLFLFFGWFRAVEEVGARFHYVPDSPDRHVLFGWLQVEERLPVAERQQLPAWVQAHPHAVAPYGKNDSLYIATDQLRLGGEQLDLPGAGLFRHYHRALCLTAPGESRSIWALPPWMHPGERGSSLSYHRRPDRWTRAQGKTLLRSVGRGQEFVLDCADYPEAVGWARELIISTRH